jgi:hypothetical protein
MLKNKLARNINPYNNDYLNSFRRAQDSIKITPFSYLSYNRSLAERSKIKSKGSATKQYY